MSDRWPPPDTPALGLGCSHIASLSTPLGRAGIARLLDQAYAGGIRVFDTADIYGQGDSERRLAPVAAKPGVAIVTKAGLGLSGSQALIRLAKPALRPVLQRLKRAGHAAAEMRQRAERNDLDPATLERRLEGSLRRLKRDRVEVFLLHSPPLEALGDGRLYELLDRVRARGLAVATGVSVRSLADAAAVIASGRVQAVQMPVNALTLAGAGPVLDAARQAGVAVIAREVLAGGARETLGLEGALGPLMADPRLSVVLTRTTRPAHLADNIAASRAARA